MATTKKLEVQKYEFPWANGEVKGTNQNTRIFTFSEESDGDHIFISDDYLTGVPYAHGLVYWRRLFMNVGGVEHWTSIYNKLLKINVPVVRELYMSEQDRALYQECFHEPVLPSLTDTMELGLTDRQNNFVAYFRHMLSKEYVIPEDFNGRGDLPL